MSIALFFLVPAGMLAVAWSFCFVGCVFQTHGLANPYSDGILTEPSLIAYWPLSDLLGSGPTPGTLNMKGQTAGAGDLFDGHSGTYTIPPAYPSGVNSDPIGAPSLTRKPSIVPGDAGSAKNPLAASVAFNGGFVNIPWSTQGSPKLPDFTVEAWFTLDPAGGNFRQALFAAIVPGDTAGFALLVENGQWQLFVGNAAAGTTINTGVGINSGYVAMTFDSSSNALSLWINPESDTPSIPATPVWPNSSSPSPPGLSYVAADPSQLTQMFIGAGATEQMLRTTDGGMGAPLFPFVGQIQSVALYGKALDVNTLESHFEIGSS